MAQTEDLRNKIHKANIAVHRIEASYYDLFHSEVYGRSEQKRIATIILKIDQQIAGNCKRALDFGAGTGNLTAKLLSLGYNVTAVDISAEMCTALRRKFRAEVKVGKLQVVNSPVEDVDFAEGSFDLVACYSVLHHLPDYEGTLRKLCSLLKKKGVMYLDHEASPYYWKTESTRLAEIVKSVYFHSNPMLNSLYFRMVGLNVPILDYRLSDYWHKKEHPLEHWRIKRVFRSERFESYNRTDYHLAGTWIFNPIFPIYKLVCRPEMSYWTAKK